VRSLPFVALIAAGAIALAGCSSGSSAGGGPGPLAPRAASASATDALPTSPPPATAPVTAQTSPLSSLVVTISEMPTGWSVNKDDTESPLQCVRTLNGIDAPETAKAAFQQGTDGDDLNEKLLRYPDAASAKAAMSAANDAAASCDGQTASANGTTFQVSSGELSFPQTKDQSRAWAAAVQLNGSTLAAVNYGFIRTGTTVLIVSVSSSYSSPDLDECQSWVQQTTAKLP
jgi:hypothetical protein